MADACREPRRFELLLGKVSIGRLRYGNGQWLFEYTDEFRERVVAGTAEAVIGFPRLDNQYTSSSLWPFFHIRIPGAYIKRELAPEQTTEVELLTRFGRKTVLNPYELIAQ